MPRWNLTRALLAAVAAVALAGCVNPGAFPPSRDYVDQRIEDVNDKIVDTWDEAYKGGLKAKADGAEDGAAALAGIAAGNEKAKAELPQRTDILSSLWTWAIAAFMGLYRLLVGRFPLLGGLAELVQGKAPAQLKRAAPKSEETA